MSRTDSWRLSGRVATGQGQGARFTALPWARAAFRAGLGIDPYPGTLNLKLESPVAREGWGRGVPISAPDPSACDARCFPVRLGGRLPGAIVVPEVSGYPADQVEVIAAVDLRRELVLTDGDELEITDAGMGGIRAVIFDVDGTLINSIEGMRIAASRATAMYGYDVPMEALRRALNFGESLWQLVVPAEAHNARELAATLRAETMRHWPQVLAESVQPFAGLEATLRRLLAAGVRLAICTGSRGESFLPLRNAGLLDLFHPIVTADDVSQPKPHPEGLLRCLAELGCAPAEAVYVGDTRQDVEAGRAAGMHSIAVLTGAGDSAILSAAGPDRLLATHDGLVDIVLAGAAPP